ncbi:MAG: GNAT family N-acetyltransferase [Vulcanimicrobiaceae bacterium]
MQIELFGVDDASRMRLALAVRVAVFVDEQRVPMEEEIDTHDRDDSRAVHAIALEGDRVVGAGRFYVRDDGHTVQIGRMAVLQSHRGRGAGRVLLHALIEAAQQRGYSRASLSAQTHAQAFYAKSGFTAEGSLFQDAGITHQEMVRDL